MLVVARWLNVKVNLVHCWFFVSVVIVFRVLERGVEVEDDRCNIELWLRKEPPGLCTCSRMLILQSYGGGDGLITNQQLREYQ